MTQAKSWDILDKLIPLTAKINPYNLIPLNFGGTALCSVTFKSQTVPVELCILPGSCQPIRDGNKVTKLQIISADRKIHQYLTQ